MTSNSNYRVVKSSQLQAKIAAYLVSIDRLLYVFLYGWRFLNKISLDWSLTLTTQPPTSKLSENPELYGLPQILISTFFSCKREKVKQYSLNLHSNGFFKLGTLKIFINRLIAKWIQCEKSLTLVASPMKKMACFPPTPKYEISLFKDLGTSATLQKKKKNKVQ